MKLMEVKENEKKITCIEGYDDDITSPITIEFIIDKKDYETLEKITEHYKWNIYDALSMLCKHSEKFITEIELDIDHQFHDKT